MNVLKIHTYPTEQPDVFMVRWTNSTVSPGGTIRVTVTHQIDDRHIVAELSAIQYLLEDREVLGKNLAGKPTTHLIVSQGAIKKLMHGRSGKEHLAPYANFLRTRFAGSKIEVDKDDRIFHEQSHDQVEDLVIGTPKPETIMVNGIGEVKVTRHVLEKLAMRLPGSENKEISSLWRKLKVIAADKAVREVTRDRKLFAGIAYAGKGNKEGRYFLNPKLNMVMIVTSNTHGRQLVTAYPANGRFSELRKAA